MDRHVRRSMLRLYPAAQASATSGTSSDENADRNADGKYSIGITIP